MYFSADSLFFCVKIEKCSSPTGDGNSVPYTSLICCICSLRNVVPRQGTETCTIAIATAPVIEKCSSPTGDGNFFDIVKSIAFFSIEKCSSPTGDGNMIFSDFNIINYPIEKCSSPTGDGNIYPFIRAQNNKLY